MNKIITVIYPNWEWEDLLNGELEKAGAKILRQLDIYNVAYDRKTYSRYACVVLVDFDKLTGTILEHMHIGDKACQQFINGSWVDVDILEVEEEVEEVEEVEETKEISLDNGMHFLSAEKAMKELEKEECRITWDNIALMMDDDTRENVHSDMAPCTELEFLKEYLKVAEEDLIIG